MGYRNWRLLLGIFCTILAGGCATKTSSYYYTQKAIEEGKLDFGKSLRVDEYINAFPQDGLPPPAKGQPLALSVDYLEGNLPATRQVTLAQVSLKTRPLSEADRRQNVGLCVVLDTSGSMNMDRKITDARESLQKAAAELLDGDEFALVTFDDDARVIIPPVKINAESRKAVLAELAKITAQASTNIEDGLLVGYQQLRRFSPGLTSRLVLITDGKSTVQVRTPQELARRTGGEYVKDAQRISTVGLGLDVDEALLREIATAGGGHYYFANSGETLGSILGQDLRSTVIPVVRDVRATFEPGKGFKINRIYGFEEYQPDPRGRVTIPLGELNLDDWRILMAEVEGVASGETAPLSVSVSYSPVNADNKVTEGDIRLLEAAPKVAWGRAGPNNLNRKVARNAVVFANAMALKEASRLSEAGNNAAALDLVRVQTANIEVAVDWDSSGALDKEFIRFNHMQFELEKQIAKNTPAPLIVVSDVTLTSGSLPPGQKSVSAVDKEANARLRKNVKKALDIAGKVAPGPWGILITVFNEVVLAE